MIWIVGNKGMLGSELSQILENRGIECVGTDKDVDILDPMALVAFAANKDISLIVNCAAYTAVDKAENEESLALRLNAEGPANLAALAVKRHAGFIHISTDYVFDGEGSVPYKENDPVAPLGAYGRTKAEGEKRIQAIDPDAIIIRTAWLYGQYGKNFVSTMLGLMNGKSELSVVADQYGSPTWAHDLAEAICAIADRTAPTAGIYHFTGEGTTTWYEFACEIQRLGLEFGVLTTPCKVKAITTDLYPTKAKRPAYSVLAKDKIKEAFGIYPPEWRDSLRKYFESIYQVKTGGEG
ncbi:dTDP-4-dehydrorhamnose reductase [uncultured spirochete]|uniref:dTDP-4-dehydrorhamnose reductase n=1 Tax=uncultured spirochete TaxID=156406 RepID=A0A3P3XSV5_9SPIR|nr:dTDP-4-dehydrorhamnose reductase [uncultured spirochete]